MRGSSLRSEIVRTRWRVATQRSRFGALGWALAAALSCAPLEPAAAGPAHEPAAATPPAGWGFTLPLLDGSRFVTLAGVAGPVLVNFWSIDCPPCRAELPALLSFAREHPGWTVLLVGTDTPADARGHLQRQAGTLPPNVWAVRGGPQVATLLRSAGNRQAALPHNLALRAGQACLSQVGLLAPEVLRTLPQRCAAAAG